MALEGDKIKDLFNSKLSSFEPEVPASIWSGLDQLLSQQPTVDVPDTSSTTSQASSTAAKTSTLKTVLIATGIAASVAVGVFVVNNSDKVEIPTIVEEVEPEVIIEEELPQEPTTIILEAADFVRPRTTKPDVIDSYSQEPEEAVYEPLISGKTETVDIAESPSIDEIEEEPPLPILPKFLKKDISLSLRTNTGALSSDINDRGGNVLFSKNERSSEFVDILKAENKEYELSHKQPISLGFTVSKNLSRKFSFETGLMFTYLSSKIASNSALNLKEEQTFGYLGIPVYINYNFYELGKANFYLSLGAMMQKDVYGKYTSKLFITENAAHLDLLNYDPSYVIYSEPAYIRRNISQSHWQFSTHLTLGASYPLYKKLRIYTSVGGAYYFDADNEYRTIFSDRKFQLDLNLGLKIDF